ncbi:hypothetical protein [Streptomyces sp. CL12-4]|uniref:hypothetical protein n=1 Tax=Streptomyces sp. CL12-4 TaxID=2810306 RepID=UPI001EFBDD38|nr:hypothetical protein [Streptomyces sp. CL12-4]MCG8970279.1 hypothetical protein [Streptomyces sp. CL12-4]
MTDFPGFIKQQVASRLHLPDGTTETTRAPAVWTLAHRGYSGSGRLDVWAYATKREALREGAELAIACGLDEKEEQARRHYEAGRYQKVLDLYEEASPETHLLRVQAAFLQFPGS